MAIARRAIAKVRSAYGDSATHPIDKSRIDGFVEVLLFLEYEIFAYSVVNLSRRKTLTAE